MRNFQSYISVKDRNSPIPTKFFIKSLSVGDYIDFFEKEEHGYRSQATLDILEKGLVGWENFDVKAKTVQEVIPYIPELVRNELIDIILKISTVSEEQQDILKLIIRWGQFIKNPLVEKQWDCDYCEEHNLQEERNCSGDIDLLKLRKSDIKHKYGFGFSKKEDEEPYVAIVGNTRYKQCPLTLMDSRSKHLVNVILIGEDLQVLPEKGGLLDQSNFWFDCRNVIVGERNKIESEMMDDVKKQTGKSTKGSELLGQKRKSSIGRRR